MNRLFKNKFLRENLVLLVIVGLIFPQYAFSDVWVADTGNEQVSRVYKDGHAPTVISVAGDPSDPLDLVLKDNEIRVNSSSSPIGLFYPGLKVSFGKDRAKVYEIQSIRYDNTIPTPPYPWIVGLFDFSNDPLSSLYYDVTDSPIYMELVRAGGFTSPVAISANKSNAKPWIIDDSEDSSVTQLTSLGREDVYDTDTIKPYPPATEFQAGDTQFQLYSKQLNIHPGIKFDLDKDNREPGDYVLEIADIDKDTYPYILTTTSGLPADHSIIGKETAKIRIDRFRDKSPLLPKDVSSNDALSDMAWVADTGHDLAVKYSIEWRYRKPISIDYTKIGEDLTDFPLMVKLTSNSGDPNYFNYSKSSYPDSGADIRFTDTSDNLLEYEIEKWVEDGTSVIWVKVPDVSSTDTTIIYMYYGSIYAQDAQAPISVWDGNFKGVWHLSEDAPDTGTVGLYKDSTSNSNDGDDYVSITGKTGMIDGGQKFNGIDDYINCGNDDSLDITGAITLSAWMNPVSSLWTKKKPITISGSTFDLTDYQVKIDVGYESDMQPDFSDLRFIDIDGNVLSYWIESYTASATAIVWVKIPSIPNSGKTIYMYYGNPTAADVSNGDSTFIFFDDFNGSAGASIDKNKWTWTEKNPLLQPRDNQATYTTDYFHSGSTGMKLVSSYYSMGEPYHSFTTPITGELIAWIYDTGIGGTTTDAVIGEGSCHNVGIVGQWLGYYGYRVNCTAHAYENTAFPRSVGWHKMKMRCDGTNTSFYIDDNPNPVATASEMSSFNQILVGNALTYSPTTAYFDDVLVRKYSSPEPSATVGNETAAGVSKAGVYGIGVDASQAFASINDQTISGTISPGGWNQIVLTCGTDEMKLYVNGVPRADTDYSDDIGTNANELLIGDLMAFNGTIDEVRISNTARSDFWIKASYYSECDSPDTHLITFGKEEDLSYIAVRFAGLLKVAGFNSPQSISVNSSDERVWVADKGLLKATIEDVGRLGASSWSWITLAVYNGKLYGGTGSLGYVYRYDGGSTWTSVGQLGTNSEVYSLAVYGGKLYGGAGMKVYRYNDDGATWTDVGQLGTNSYFVLSLTVYDGNLYSGTYSSGRVYRYDGGSIWTDVGRLGFNGQVHSLAVYDGKLYGGTYPSGKVYRYDGPNNWTDVGRLGTNSQVYSLAVYDGKLYGGTDPGGRVYRYDGGSTWTDVGRLGNNTEVRSLAVYNGKLYGGAGTSGRVYCYNDDGATWTDIGPLGTNSWVPSLAVYDGKLYGGTGYSGRVYSITDEESQPPAVVKLDKNGHKTIEAKVIDSYVEGNSWLFVTDISELDTGINISFNNRQENAYRVVDIVSQYPPDWWNNGQGLPIKWVFRKPLTFSTAESFNNFPIMVKLTPASAGGNFDYTHSLASNGADIRFVDADTGDALPYEIEEWKTNDTSIIWVNVHEISSTDTVYMYYGNPDALDAQVPENVWNAGFKGVWHMNSTSWRDSTSNGNSSNGTEVSSPTITSGKINSAAYFKTPAPYIDCGNDISLDITDAITTEAWVKGAGSDFSSAQITSSQDFSTSRYNSQFQVVGDKIYYVWEEWDGRCYQIYMASMNTDGTGFSILYNTTGDSGKNGPQLQVEGAKIYYVWQQSGQIYTAKMDTDGTNFSILHHTTGSSSKNASQFQVVGNKIYYVWLESISGYEQIVTSSMNTDGTGWSSTQRTTSSFYKSRPQFQVIENENKIYYVWQEKIGSYYQLYTAKMNTDGTGGFLPLYNTTSSSSKFASQLQVVGSEIYYVWQEWTSGAYQIYTAKMNTDGPPYNFSILHYTTGNFSKDNPQFQVVEGDKIYYVWRESTSGAYQIYTADMPISSGIFSTPQQRTTSNSSKDNPQLQVVGSEIYYVWEEVVNSYFQIFTAKMNTDGTGDFLPPLYNTTGGGSSKFAPQLQVVGDKIYYVWQEWDGSFAQIYTADMTISTGIFSTPQQRTTGNSNKIELQFQVVGDKIYYVWREMVGSSSQLYTADMTISSGIFSTPQQRTTGSGSEKYVPQLQVVGDKIYYVWLEWTTGSSSQIWTAEMPKGGGTFSSAQRRTGNLLKLNPQFQVVGNTIYYVWGESDGTNYQIWTAEMPISSGIFSTPQQRTTSSSYKSRPQFQVVGDEIYYIWQEMVGSYYQILTAKMNTGGTGGFAILSTTTGGSSGKYEPQFQVVGDELYYIWREGFGSYYHIYTAKMDTDGQNFSVLHHTTDGSNKSEPQFQVVGGKLYYIWLESTSGTYQICTASINSNFFSKGDFYGLGISYDNVIKGFIDAGVDGFKYKAEAIDYTAGATVDTTIDNTQWNHIVMTYNKDESQLKLYVNGNLADTSSFSESINTNPFDLIIGGNFTGAIDEVRISNAAFSDSWIKAQYDSMTDNFIIYGTEEGTGVKISPGLKDNLANGSSIGRELARISGFSNPISVSVDSTSGNCWVADGSDTVVWIDGNIGEADITTAGYDINIDSGYHKVIKGFNNPVSVSVDPGSGDCWVACKGEDGGDSYIVKLFSTVQDGYDITTTIGSHIKVYGFNSPQAVSVEPPDGNCWVADKSDQIVKLSPDGHKKSQYYVVEAPPGGYPIGDTEIKLESSTGEVVSSDTSIYPPLKVSFNKNGNEIRPVYEIESVEDDKIILKTGLETSLVDGDPLCHELVRVGGFNSPSDVSAFEGEDLGELGLHPWRLQVKEFYVVDNETFQGDWHGFPDKIPIHDATPRFKWQYINIDGSTGALSTLASYRINIFTRDKTGNFVKVWDPPEDFEVKGLDIYPNAWIYTDWEYVLNTKKENDSTSIYSADYYSGTFDVDDCPDLSQIVDDITDTGTGDHTFYVQLTVKNKGSISATYPADDADMNTDSPIISFVLDKTPPGSYKVCGTKNFIPQADNTDSDGIKDKYNIKNISGDLGDPGVTYYQTDNYYWDQVWVGWDGGETEIVGDSFLPSGEPIMWVPKKQVTVRVKVKDRNNENFKTGELAHDGHNDATEFSEEPDNCSGISLNAQYRVSLATSPEPREWSDWDSGICEVRLFDESKSDSVGAVLKTGGEKDQFVWLYAKNVLFSDGDTNLIQFRVLDDGSLDINRIVNEKDSIDTAQVWIAPNMGYSHADTMLSNSIAGRDIKYQTSSKTYGYKVPVDSNVPQVILVEYPSNPYPHKFASFKWVAIDSTPCRFKWALEYSSDGGNTWNMDYNGDAGDGEDFGINESSYSSSIGSDTENWQTYGTDATSVSFDRLRVGGLYRFWVKAKDRDGAECLLSEVSRRVSGPAVWVWRVSPEVPNTIITYGPSGQTEARNVGFRWKGIGGTPPYTYQYRVNREDWEDSTVDGYVNESDILTYLSVTSLKIGKTYVFEARVADSIGNIDPTPAKRIFTVVDPSHPPYSTISPKNLYKYFREIGE